MIKYFVTNLNRTIGIKLKLPTSTGNLTEAADIKPSLIINFKFLNKRYITFANVDHIVIICFSPKNM